MSRYQLHPSYAYQQGILDNLKAKTGRSYAEWLAELQRQKLETESAQRDYLKKDMRLGTQQAALIAERAQGKGRAEDYRPEALVAQMFAGKPALLPVYEQVLDFALSLSGVQASPCATIVPLYRGHVFAQLKPASKSRLELGLCLRGEPFSGRLKDTGGSAKKDRITHRIDLATAADFDTFAQHWLHEAWQRSAQ